MRGFDTIKLCLYSLVLFQSTLNVASSAKVGVGIFSALYLIASKKDQTDILNRRWLYKQDIATLAHNKHVLDNIDSFIASLESNIVKYQTSEKLVHKSKLAWSMMWFALYELLSSSKSRDYFESKFKPLFARLFYYIWTAPETVASIYFGCKGIVGVCDSLLYRTTIRSKIERDKILIALLTSLKAKPVNALYYEQPIKNNSIVEI
jgi:hypothetical protein